MKSNKSKDAVDRSYSKIIFRKVFGKFFIHLLIFFAILMVIWLILQIISTRFNWDFLYDSFPPLYIFLNYGYHIVLVLFPIVIVIGLFIILYIDWKKSLYYLDVIAKASNDLIDSNVSFIELPDELGQIGNHMNQLKQTALRNEKIALETEQRKNDLIMYLAHDLKTPLTSVIGYLELLKESSDLPINQRIKYTGIALDKSYRLEDLMNEFFEIARFNDINITLMKRELNIKLLLEQIIDEFYPLLQENNKQIKLECPERFTIMADSDKISRAINNVIKNAVAYSFENTEITIVVKKIEANTISISIENKGFTIPQAKLDNIFEKFYRLDDSRGTKTGGAGLGLAIAKELITLHKGSIKAESNDGITKFTIMLPMISL